MLYSPIEPDTGDQVAENRLQLQKTIAKKSELKCSHVKYVSTRSTLEETEKKSQPTCSFDASFAKSNDQDVVQESLAAIKAGFESERIVQNRPTWKTLKKPRRSVLETIRKKCQTSAESLDFSRREAHTPGTPRRSHAALVEAVRKKHQTSGVMPEVNPRAIEEETPCSTEDETHCKSDSGQSDELETPKLSNSKANDMAKLRLMGRVCRAKSNSSIQVFSPIVSEPVRNCNESAPIWVS